MNIFADTIAADPERATRLGYGPTGEAAQEDPGPGTASVEAEDASSRSADEVVVADAVLGPVTDEGAT